MAYYQCFKTKARDVYCSSTTFKSHQPAAQWVAACMAHYNIQANELLGRPYESDDQPEGAVIYP